MKYYLILMMFFISLGIYSQIGKEYSLTKNEIIKINKRKIKDEFFIKSYSLTSRYYLIKALNSKNEKVLLVVYKNSKQIKNRKIEKGKRICLVTYSFFDLFAYNADICHYVDGKKVWCYTDKIDLRFTDGLGDDIIESEQ